MGSTAESRAAVIVVGAGPVGLSTALALRSQGVAVRVVEAQPADRSRPGSRAIFVHRASLDLLDAASRGLGDLLVAHGIRWQTKRTCWRGKEVFSRTYPPPDPTRPAPFTSLPQTEIEQHLLERCKAADVEFSWDCPVSAMDVTGDGVAVRTRSGETFLANYAIGADGASSTVRELLGITMQGSRSDNTFVIVDVAEDPDDPLPVERVFHYEHPAVEGRHVLLVPFAGGWRVDLQCRENDDLQAFSGVAAVREWLPKVIDGRHADRISWVSHYQFLQVVADSFVDEQRRVLLVGEAAHLFAPFGARGMNSGIADASAAARAIRSGLDRPSVARTAIEEFARSRREAAEYNRRAAGMALAHMQARGPVPQAKRRLAAAAALLGARAGAWLDRAPYGPRSGPETGGSKY